MGCGRAQGVYECQTRKEDECDAKASGRSPDAVWRRNPPVPFGLQAARGHLLRWNSLT